ncbi:hypothetical protein QEN19_001736 [Hanseniaspora menglaensis]
MSGDPIDKLRVKLLNSETTSKILKEDFLVTLENFNSLLEFAKVQTNDSQSDFYNKNFVDILKNNEALTKAAHLFKIHEQYTHAYTYDPESFTTSCMLYVAMKINNVPIIAFVDSGAEKSLLSSQFLEVLDLEKYLDKRFKGQARGVGTGEINGRLHHVMLQFGNEFLSHSLTVLESLPSPILIGIDFMKKYRCIIDFQENCFKINDLGIELPFLNEPQIAKFNNRQLKIEEYNEIIDENQTFKKMKLENTEQSIIQKAEEKKEASFVANEDHLLHLSELGFPKEKVLEALSLANNDIDKAAQLLMDM